MEERATPINREAAYEVVALSSSIVSLQHVTGQPAIDGARLIAVGKADQVAGASHMTAGAMLLGAAVPAGSEAVSAAADPAAEARIARKLDRIGATVAAAMVHGAVSFERGVETGILAIPGART